MAATLITYTDKVNNSTSALPANKKAGQTDFNEIKTAVNTNAALHDSVQAELTDLKTYAGATAFNYIYDSSTVAADPGAGNFRANTLFPATWTILQISATDLNFNVNTILQAMISGSYIYIQDREDPRLGGFYTVFSVTDNTTYFTFVLNAPIGNNGSLTNGDLCAMTFIPVPVPASGSVATDPIFDNKGDIPIGTANDTAAVLGAGTNGQILAYASGEATGLKKTDFLYDTAVLVGQIDTDLTTSTTEYFTINRAVTLTEVVAYVETAATGAAISIDITEGGVSIFSTVLTIDATENSSETAAVPAVISDPNIANGAKMIITVNQVGSTVAGQNLQVTLKGYTAL